MPTFGYATQAELFDYGAEAELFATSPRKYRGQPSDTSDLRVPADAIRFEDLPLQLLLGTYLEVGELRYEGREIRRLYESADYPLTRAANGPGR
jgi:hypothetical protein